MSTTVNFNFLPGDEVWTLHGGRALKCTAAHLLSEYGLTSINSHEHGRNLTAWALHSDGTVLTRREIAMFRSREDLVAALRGNRPTYEPRATVELRLAKGDRVWVERDGVAVAGSVAERWTARCSDARTLPTAADFVRDVHVPPSPGNRLVDYEVASVRESETFGSIEELIASL